MRLFSLLFAMLLMTNALSFADELDEALEGFKESASTTLDEEALSGFDEQSDIEGLVVNDEAQPSWYNMYGYLSFLGAYNYAQSGPLTAVPGDKQMDFSGLSRARSKLDVALEMKHTKRWKSRIEVMGWYDSAWAIHGRENYTQDLLDTYEYFYDIKDAYIQGTLSDSLDIKIGRQVVIWGKSDSIRITDVINPLDNREPGIVDIKDLRLSEVMSKLDYYFGDYGLSAIIIHEPRLEIEPAFGSDYRPRDIFGAPIADEKFPKQYQPSWSIENTQYALSLDGRYEGWDLSWYAANVMNSRFSIGYDDNTMVRTYDKIYMLGVATNVVSGAWLYKAEAAYIMDINYRSVKSNKNRLDALLGIDYSGLKKTILSLELSNRHIFAYEDIMLQNTFAQGIVPDYVREDTVQSALRASYTFDHDNATINYLLSMLGGSDFAFNDGGFHRFWMEYKLNDNFSANAGVVDYLGGDGEIPFYNAIQNSDRVYAEVVYNF